MSLRQRVGSRRLSVVIPPNQKDETVDFEQATSSPGNGGNLSPDLPATPPTYPIAGSSASTTSPLLAGGDSNHPLGSPQDPPIPQAYKIGQYILLQQTDTVGNVQVYRAFHSDTHEEYVCKVVAQEKFQRTFSAYFTVGYHEHVNVIEEVIHGAKYSYVFFARHYGDLHSYVRRRRRLREPEAGALFQQIMLAVQHCHDNGLVLRDLKLRKFVFKNPQKTELKLECVEDAYVLGEDKDDDWLADKHGCPAYVSPEILQCQRASYSGRAADMWSAGVMLYTLLVGRYPFHDVQPNALFTKIRRGEYRVPDNVSARAKCLIRSLLRKEPAERLTADQVLAHPWFCHGSKIYSMASSSFLALTSSSSVSTSSSSSNNKQTTSTTTAASESVDHLVPQLPPQAAEQEPLPWFL